MSAERIGKTHFESAVGGRFRVSEPQIELTLKSVTEGLAASEDYECFSIEFQGSKQTPLEQGTFELTHETLGTFSLFMTPVEEDERSRTYQAVFNRPRSAD